MKGKKKRFQFVYPVVLIFALSAISQFAIASEGRFGSPEKIMSMIRKIEGNLTYTEYRHQTRVRVKQGDYRFDCSGMANWILRRTAPVALKTVGRPNDRRPLAVHFFRTISRVKPGKSRGGWYRPATVAHAEPGDVLAWVRPKWFPSKSTGHVAFVVEKPRMSTGEVRGITVKIADASKFKHEDDSRPEGTTGFGTGVLLIPTDSRGNPQGYGWVGNQTKKDWIVPTKLVIGRPLR